MTLAADPSKGVQFNPLTLERLHLRLEQVAARLVLLTDRVEQLESAIAAAGSST